MKRAISKFLKWFAGLITVAVALPYLGTVLIPYIDTGKYWYVSILGLGFPILFFMMLTLLVFWLGVRSKFWILFCLIVMLAGFQQIRVAFAFNFWSSFKMEKPEGSLRIMQWNVHNWNQIKFENERDFDMDAQPHMMKLIEKYNADVLCIEEFFESVNREKLPSNIAILRAMGYEFFYFLHPGVVNNEYSAGIAIFSKYPMKESGEIKMAEGTNTDPLAYADIQVGDQRVRLITLHLQSVEFHSEQFEHLSELKRTGRTDRQESRTIISKLKRGFERRYEEAISVNQQIEQSPYPIIVCGDLNDVPNSGVYFTITRHLQDAFLKKGFFMGRTFRFISPTLRIDYILPDKNFSVKQFKRINVPYSDHYPLVADMELK